MKKHSIWSSNVNFYISIIFIGVFGLTTTSFLLRFAGLDDPIATSLTASIVTAEE